MAAGTGTALPADSIEVDRMVAVEAADSIEADQMVVAEAADSSLSDRATMEAAPRVLYYRPESAADARVAPDRVVGSLCTSLSGVVLMYLQIKTK